MFGLMACVLAGYANRMQGSKDEDERCWIRSNLSAEALEKFQATVHGIHRRFDEVMARRGK